MPRRTVYHTHCKMRSLYKYPELDFTCSRDLKELMIDGSGRRNVLQVEHSRILRCLCFQTSHSRVEALCSNSCRYFLQYDSSLELEFCLLCLDLKIIDNTRSPSTLSVLFSIKISTQSALLHHAKSNLEMLSTIVAERRFSVPSRFIPNYLAACRRPG